MTRKQTPDPDDINLFRQTVGDVVTVKSNTVVQKKSVRPSRPAPAGHGDRNASIYFEEFVPDKFRVSANDHIQFKRPGLQDKVFHKLRRGQLPVTATLDLHGMTGYNAKLALDRFLHQRNKSAGQTCVRVIHGKGIGSRDGQPKIKQYMQIWLQDNMDVMAYSSCMPRDGGTGAVYLLLKSR
jgi:DNA-nicking Smr family endonuclease